MAAECLPPAVAQQLIYEAAERAVTRLREGRGPAPLRLSAPIEVVVELVTSEMADRAAILPAARRLEGKKVGFGAQDMVLAYRAFRSLVALARE